MDGVNKKTDLLLQILDGFNFIEQKQADQIALDI